MTHPTTARLNMPAWVELSSPDAAASRDFYAKLFGWDIEVSDDPQYGGYGMARLAGEDVAGIGPKMSPQAPTAWSLYFGNDDLDALATKVTDAGGTVVMAPFAVGEMGRMAVFQDTTGGFFSAWQGARMATFRTNQPGAFGWCELNARGVDKAIAFYDQVFGWTHESSPMGEGGPLYTEFKYDGHSIGGAWEMNEMVPAAVPSYWQVYFKVEDAQATFDAALAMGAKGMVGPMDYPGGRFAIMTDPHGASFAFFQGGDR